MGLLYIFLGEYTPSDLTSYAKKGEPTNLPLLYNPPSAKLRGGVISLAEGSLNHPFYADVGSPCQLRSMKYRTCDYYYYLLTIVEPTPLNLHTNYLSLSPVDRGISTASLP
jgi:hypothetical protein